MRISWKAVTLFRNDEDSVKSDFVIERSDCMIDSRLCTSKQHEQCTPSRNCIWFSSIVDGRCRAQCCHWEVLDDGLVLADRLIPLKFLWIMSISFQPNRQHEGWSIHGEEPNEEGLNVSRRNRRDPVRQAKWWDVVAKSSRRLCRMGSCWLDWSLRFDTSHQAG